MSRHIKIQPPNRYQFFSETILLKLSHPSHHQTLPLHFGGTQEELQANEHLNPFTTPKAQCLESKLSSVPGLKIKPCRVTRAC